MTERRLGRREFIDLVVAGAAVPFLEIDRVETPDTLLVPRRTMYPHRVHPPRMRQLVLTPQLRTALMLLALSDIEILQRVASDR